jgi:excisionase family DNA binding protein
MERLLTVKEAALLLSCSQAAVRKWVYQRRFPVVKVGRLVRVRPADLEATVAKGLRKPLAGQAA